LSTQNTDLIKRKIAAPLPTVMPTHQFRRRSSGVSVLELELECERKRKPRRADAVAGQTATAAMPIRNCRLNKSQTPLMLYRCIFSPGVNLVVAAALTKHHLDRQDRALPSFPRIRNNSGMPIKLLSETPIDQIAAGARRMEIASSGYRRFPHDRETKHD